MSYMVKMIKNVQWSRMLNINYQEPKSVALPTRLRLSRVFSSTTYLNFKFSYSFTCNMYIRYLNYDYICSFKQNKRIKNFCCTLKYNFGTAQ